MFGINRDFLQSEPKCLTPFTMQLESTWVVQKMRKADRSSNGVIIFSLF